jgi:hypothetical protein
MSHSTHENAAADPDAEAQTPTPSPTSGQDAGEFTTGAAPERTGDSAETAPESEVPADEELEEPSTEKEPSDEPEAPERSEPEADHDAIGIGVINNPQSGINP